MAQNKIYGKIIIDLEENQRSLVPISESLFVDFDPREYKGMMGRLLEKLSMKRSIKEVAIGVKDIKCSRNLILSENTQPENLFSLIIEGEAHNEVTTPIDVTLTKERTPFQLYFKPALIADCEDIQGIKDKNELYTVSGTAFIQNEAGEILATQNFQIDIELKDLIADVKVDLTCLRRLEYKKLPSNRIIQIGEIQITNPKKFERSPAINFEGKLTLIGPDGTPLPDLKDEDGSIRPRIRIIGTSKPDVKVDNIRSREILIDGHHEFEPDRLGIEIDLSDIKNPVAPFDKYSIRVVGNWAYSTLPDIPHLISETKEFRLMKDNQGTELRAVFEGETVSSNGSYQLSIFEFSPGGVFRDEKILELSNIATDSSRGGKLRIMPARISTKILEEGLHVYNANGKAIDLSKIVTLDGDLWEEMQENGYVEIENGASVPELLKIMFNPAEIYSINNGGQYRFTINSSIEFDYYENEDNRPWDQLEKKTFRMILTRPMFILPFPEWLCVDYGSSAIVSLYKGKVLDLNSRRKNIFTKIGSKEKEWSLRTPGNEVETEKETQFISSDLILNLITGIDSENPVSTLCGEQSFEQLDYSKTSVCLAPTPNLVKSNYVRILPCLKLLVGNQYLPDNQDYNNYEYYRRDPHDFISRVKLIDSKENDEPNSLASINNLFDEAYKVVFRHYLSQLIPHIERVNRLVLTYPNSYTPDHLKVLKSIATDTFRYLREGQLRFVSESDAVAAYYMDHWREYNPGESMTKDESILVFDMGAGTLDLTYLVKQYDSSTKTYTLDIKGKIGISKAGNYLDFVLASIVAEKGGKVTKDLAKTERPAGANADRIAKGRIALKDFVKNQLKPALSYPDDEAALTFSYSGTDITITISEVLRHKNFKEYLNEVTSQVIESLQNYLQSALIVDTVILSGRSVRLKPLQETLSRVFKSLSSKNKGVVNILDLGSIGEEDRQKTAVVEGAVKFAGSYGTENSKVIINSRRLYASFGVAFKRIGGDLEYTELASHSQMPFTNEKRLKEFPKVLLKDLSHTQEIRLIQSYLSPEQTLQALKDNDFEYISEMNTYDLSSFAGKDSLEMSIAVDRHNQVSLYVDGHPTIGNTPKGVDLNNVITRRSIWPATI